MKKSPQKSAAARPAASRKAPAKKASAQDALRLSVKLPGIWFSKSAARKARNAAQGKEAAKPASKAPAPAKKPAPAKPAPKKPAPPARKAPAKKSPPVNPSPKKAPAKKPAPAKKTPPKKAEVKKPEVRKPVKKAAPKKAPPKKAPAKKVEAKKPEVAKPSTKKAGSGKTAGSVPSGKNAEKKDKGEKGKVRKDAGPASSETPAPVVEPPAPEPAPAPAPAPEPEPGLGPISPPVVMTGPSTLPPEIVPLVPSVDEDDLFAEEAAPAPQESASFTKKELAEFRAKLLALRSRHSGKAASLQAQSLTRPDEVNPEEDGTDASMRITEISKASIDEASVNDIDAALRAIDAGTYGVCQTCGGRIAKARLRAVPFAKNCASCQSEMEQDAARRRAPPTADYYG